MTDCPACDAKNTDGKPHTLVWDGEAYRSICDGVPRPTAEDLLAAARVVQREGEW